MDHLQFHHWILSHWYSLGYWSIVAWTLCKIDFYVTDMQNMTGVHYNVHTLSIDASPSKRYSAISDSMVSVYIFYWMPVSCELLWPWNFCASALTRPFARLYLAGESTSVLLVHRGRVLSIKCRWEHVLFSLIPGFLVLAHAGTMVEGIGLYHPWFWVAVNHAETHQELIKS